MNGPRAASGNTVSMTSRERVLRTFRFEPVDRAPFDLMEGCIWAELQQFMAERYGLDDAAAIGDHFDTDYRWCGPTVAEPSEQEGAALAPRQRPEGTEGTYSEAAWRRPLADAAGVADVEAFAWPDPERWDFSGVAAARERWPDKAVAVLTAWMPMFCSACDMFGMEKTLADMIAAPEIIEAFAERQHRFLMGITRRACEAAQGVADIIWLGDDVADQRTIIMGPERWRRFFKERPREQFALVRGHGLIPLFHSCAAVRDILPDLIEIGAGGLLTFQTSASGMDAAGIARDFGGRLAFYGGIDVQQLLTFGTPDQVRAEVRKNVDLFAQCGGYTVANAHHGVANIRPENVVAMLEEARQYRPGA